MKKNEIFILLAFISSFCFAKPAPEPEWFRNYKKVYPNSEYIAQRGSGKTAEDAKTDAAAQLARFFQSTVNANLSTTMTSITSGTSIEEETRVVDEVNVASEVEFIGLEFTESWYYKPEKKWYAVAYVVREDAWIQYRPKIEAEKAKFYGFYKKAEKETDSFTKIALYRSAWKSSSGFMEKLEYGRIISPKEEEKYSADREAVSDVPSKIEAEQKKLTVEVRITGDYGNIIETSVKKSFAKCGFVVGAKGNYVADVNVNSNQTGNDPLSIMPAVIITIRNKDGKSIYSYEANLTEKTVAYTLETAQKKAFPKLAEIINREINF
ncbi:MAG: LPP20 family lipoprotein [Treponema sp.]|nr:LPP20 family lipoprotein [Treponema sp.]MDY5838617.1 LPP20 family lipoprotein [Treponema sp.]